ncbi:MAG: DUF3048 domain-containing protein [Candidatus Nomurabacteria bacterium]|nr:MAG: DUF3048 domain-containing protein [Candidatus Nomurabacteria bacterium]
MPKGDTKGEMKEGVEQVAVPAKPQGKMTLWLKKRPVQITLVVVVLAVVALAGFLLTRTDDSDDGQVIVTNTNQPSEQKVRRVLDGVLDVAANKNPRPVGVMIENLSIVRPQSGLGQANVVYEALVEGGITRFLAVYLLTDDIPELGPVRSARPYYVDWANELGAIYAHAGGSPTALADIRSKDVFDLDQFYNSQYYWRKNLPRATEHTLFTSTELLQFALRDKEATMTGDYTGWKFKEEAALADRPLEVNPIVLDYSSKSYEVKYTYNREENTYLRFQGDEAHTDQNTGEQISPKNVLVQYVGTRLADATRLSMDVVGSGDAILFRDGEAIPARWSKSSTSARTIFTDLEGQQLIFNAGQTWVQVFPDDRQVTY